MKLTLRFPIALGLACGMMLSSCSKEDAQMPQPQSESTNVHSGAKTNAGEAVLPYFAHTIAETGYNVYPTNWVRMIMAVPDNVDAAPTGISSLTNLWGNPLTKWVKPLPPVPSYPRATSVITTRSQVSLGMNSNQKPAVTTTISNLQPGKTYAVTFYVSTTIRNQVLGYNTQPAYANSAQIKLYPDTYASPIEMIVNLTGKEAEWVKKTITFKAVKSNATFAFIGLAPQAGQYSYTHLFVDDKAIKELTTFQPVVVQ